MSATRETWARGRLWRGGLWVILAVALFFRLYALGRLPGINGDEAWYGVLVRHFLQGDAVQWRTPSGNLPSPSHIGLLLLLQRVLPASLALLRVPSVLSSLAGLGLTYAVVRRHFDRSTGALALVWMAVLPVNIAYARFGWDPSHSAPLALGATHFALAGNPLGCALLFALSLTIHPTLVFLAPFLVLVSAFADLERGGWRRALPRTGGLVVLLLLALKTLAFTSTEVRPADTLAAVLPRLRQPSQWTLFAQRYADFLSGDGVCEYIAGSGLGAAQKPAAIAVGVVLGGLLGVWGWRLRREGVGREVGVVLGWAASVLCFFALGGNESIWPPVGRYALCLVVPTVLALAVMLRELGGRGAHLLRPYALTGVLAVLLLAGFWLRYFRALETTGSTGHETFWTGAREPKQVAFEHILAEASPRGGARVIAENWWLYLPIAYLAEGGPLRVFNEQPGPEPTPPGGTYWVVFAQGPMDRGLAATHAAMPHWDIPGAARPVALRVWWLPASPAPR